MTDDTPSVEREAIERFISQFESGSQGCDMDADDAQIFAQYLRTALDAAEAAVAAVLREAAGIALQDLETVRAEEGEFSGTVFSMKQDAKAILALTPADAAQALDRMLADAKAEGMEKAAFIAWDKDDETIDRPWEDWGMDRSRVVAQTVGKEINRAILATAAAIRAGKGK